MNDRPENSTNGADPGRVVEALRRIMRAHDLDSRALESEYGVTAPQLLCLRTAAAGDRLTAGDIARRIHLSASTLVGILDRLEDKGLIERLRDPADRRRSPLRVTPRGRRLLRRRPSLLGRRLGAALDRLSGTERKRLGKDLARVADLVESADAETEGSE
jgi:DNA-binding MarR family transcriptional regulator